MYSEPCMKLTTLSVPKMSDSPAATRNSSMPLIRPPVPCVTTHEADAKQFSNAWKSNDYSSIRSSHTAPCRPPLLDEERCPRSGRGGVAQLCTTVIHATLNH